MANVQLLTLKPFSLFIKPVEVTLVNNLPLTMEMDELPTRDSGGTRYLLYLWLNLFLLC